MHIFDRISNDKQQCLSFEHTANNLFPVRLLSITKRLFPSVQVPSCPSSCVVMRRIVAWHMLLSSLRLLSPMLSLQELVNKLIGCIACMQFSDADMLQKNGSSRRAE